MNGKAVLLRGTVERCLSDDSKKRPPIQEVSAFIKPLKVSVIVIIMMCLIIIIQSRQLGN